MNTIYKVGIYLRLSREDERLGESGSISTQREMLLNYIKENNLSFVREYVDDGVSGTTFDRVGFKEMIRDCENGKINMIITKDTSRLGRDHIEFGYYVERYFPEHNIRYVAINDGIDTFSNNSANDMLVFKSAFNDMYVKDISNKLRSSLLSKKRSGLFVGCYAPYGYKKSSSNKHKLEIDREASIIVKRIFNMFINGNSVTKICDLLTMEHIATPSIYKNMNLGQNNIHFGVWSTKTVTDILKNPTYMGNLTQGRQKKVSYKSKKRIHTNISDWVISEGSVEAIIDKGTFELVQDMFKCNKNRYKSSNGITNNLLLRGLIYCKECGHTIGFRNTNNRIYGNCNYWVKRKREGVCSPHSVKYKDIEDLVMRELKKRLCGVDVNRLDYMLKKDIYRKNNIMGKICKIDNNILNIRRKIDVCYNDKLEGNITLDMYKKVYNNLNLEINKLNSDKIRILNMSDRCYLDSIKDLINLNNKSLDFIGYLIKKIEIDEDKNIFIYYNFCETIGSYSSDSVTK